MFFRMATTETHVMNDCSGHKSSLLSMHILQRDVRDCVFQWLGLGHQLKRGCVGEQYLQSIVLFLAHCTRLK